MRSAAYRTQLRTAYQMLATMGAAAFAERARRELLDAGETARKRAAQTRTELTAQEASIARLARHGQTNTEIGAQLFLSARTVEWHLGNVFTKLGISSRRELRRALAHPGQADPPRSSQSSGDLARISQKLDAGSRFARCCRSQ